MNATGASERANTEQEIRNQQSLGSEAGRNHPPQDAANPPPTEVAHFRSGLNQPNGTLVPALVRFNCDIDTLRHDSQLQTVPTSAAKVSRSHKTWLWGQSNQLTCVGQAWYCRDGYSTLTIRFLIAWSS